MAHSPEEIRAAVAKQHTVAHSVIALLDGIVAASAEDGAQAWAKAYTADPRAWSDAILANTPHAIETTERAAPVSPAPEKKAPDKPNQHGHAAHR